MVLGRARQGAKSGGTGKPPVYDSPAPQYSPPSNDTAQTTTDDPRQSASAHPETQGNNSRRREAEGSDLRDTSVQVSASATAIPDNNRRHRGLGAREDDSDDTARERSQVESPEAGESSHPENDNRLQNRARMLTAVRITPYLSLILQTIASVSIQAIW